MWRYLFLIPSIVFSASAFAGYKHQTSIVVQPLRVSDEASRKTADILRQKLSGIPSLYVVDPEKVSAVLKYYENDSLSSNTAEVQTAKDLLSRAKEHYFQFAFSEAEAELNKVVEIFKHQPGLVFRDGQILVDGWMTLGLLFSAKKEEAKAIQAFQEVIKLEPNTPLDSKAFAPSIRKLFEKARNRDGEEKQEKASLVIAGEPKVTEIYLNGIYQGVSPLTLSPLPAGEYALSFRAHNYQPFEQSLHLEPGEKRILQHKLYWEGVQKQKSGAIQLEIEKGVTIAELLKVDKVLLVDVEKEGIQTRLIDRGYRASHKPIFISLRENAKGLEENIGKLVRLIFAQTQLNLLKNPQAHLDPAGIGDPILLGARRGKFSKKVLFGGLGAMGVGGILAVLFSGRGSSPPQTGSIALSFK